MHRIVFHLKYFLFRSVISHTVPTSPPQNLSGVPISSTEIILQWIPPILSGQNGIIKSYTIVVLDMQANTTTIFHNSNGIVLIRSLHPFYNYEMSVAADTVGTGPFTTPVVVRTLEDGE